MAKTFVNGKIFVGTDENNFATSMIEENGKIIWIGDNPILKDNVVDLGGKTVLPGLIDCHTHPKYIADALHGVACTPPYVNSITDMQNALRNSPQFDKGHNVWIEGWGFDETKLKEHRSPNIHDLDAVTTKQPIFIYRSDCHSSVCNSKALEIAGINKNTPNPIGGTIEHFDNGEPNGYMREVAATQLLVRAKSSQSYQTDVNNMKNSSIHYLENGLVAISEMMGRLHPYSSLKLYQDALKLGFKPKVSIYYVYDEISKNDFIKPEGNDNLCVKGIKIFMDGSISGQTAYDSEPYKSGKSGIKLTDKEKLREEIDFAKKNNLQVAIHAMGDSAIQLVLDVTKDDDPWLDDIPSVRIEHASLLNDRMLEQIKNAKMNYALITQPIFFFAEDESYRNFLNDEQFKEVYRIKSMMKTKRLVALSSDAPCTPWYEPDSPFYNMYAAVTRKTANNDIVNKDEAINIRQAVLAYTKYPAEIGGFSNNGTLEVGKSADFVILNNDIFSVDNDDIKNIRVIETWIDGKKVYDLNNH